MCDTQFLPRYALSHRASVRHFYQLITGPDHKAHIHTHAHTKQNGRGVNCVLCDFNALHSVHAGTGKGIKPSSGPGPKLSWCRVSGRSVVVSFSCKPCCAQTCGCFVCECVCVITLLIGPPVVLIRTELRAATQERRATVPSCKLLTVVR